MQPDHFEEEALGPDKRAPFALHQGPAPLWQQRAGRALLALFGWKIVGGPGDCRRFVGVCAPHTSNWDTFFWVCLSRAYGLRAHWMCKQDLFVGPLGALLRWTGAVPVERSARQNYVVQMVHLYERNSEFILAIAVEGTRHHTEYWKSGFYHIARAAEVPIRPVYLNYRSKEAGMGAPLWLSGDVDSDMDHLRTFYAGVEAKFPAQKSRIRLHEEDESLQQV